MGLPVSVHRSDTKMRVGRYIAITVGASALLVSGVAPAAAGTLPTSGTAAGAASQAGHDQKQVPLRKVAPKGFAIGVAVAGGDRKSVVERESVGLGGQCVILK